MALPIKRLGLLLALSTTSVLVCLAVVEIALRTFAPADNMTHWERHPALGWCGRSSLRATIRTKATTTRYSHNRDGFRDRDRRIEKPPGVIRILCVGDSFTWGWGVPQNAVYTRELQRLLERGGATVEVLSAGVGGYNTVQSLQFLLERGFSYSPDIVIHQATGNDLPENGHSLPPGSPWERPYAVLAEDGAVEIRGTPLRSLTPLGWLKYQLPRHSRLGFAVRLRLGRCAAWLARRRAAERPTASVEQDGVVDRPLCLFAALVRRMERECSSRGVRYVLLADFPLRKERSTYWRQECSGIEAHFVSEYLRQKEEETGEAALIPDDGHWTESAHRWIAEYLGDQVLSEMNRREEPS